MNYLHHKIVSYNDMMLYYKDAYTVHWLINWCPATAPEHSFTHSLIHSFTLSVASDL